jgi:3-oxoacyl-[acyl-carrier protein] reductase
MSKLTGKIAVVTGASKGIGAAIAKSLAAEGATVVVNYASSKTGADTVVAAITAAGGKAIAVGGDVSKAPEANGIIDAAIKNYGRLDILVNNSGVYEFTPIEAITEEQFHKAFNVNVLGLLLTTQAAVKHLSEGASIINVGSVASRITPPNSAVYAGTKGAVDAITGVLSRELGPISRRPPSRRLRSAASANLATSPPSLSFWRRKTPPGSPASNFSLPVAFALPRDSDAPQAAADPWAIACSNSSRLAGSSISASFCDRYR